MKWQFPNTFAWVVDRKYTKSAWFCKRFQGRDTLVFVWGLGLKLDMALESTVRLTVVFLHMYFYFPLYIRLRAKYIEYMTPKLNEFDSSQDYNDFWPFQSILQPYICMCIYIYIRFEFQTIQLTMHVEYVVHVSCTGLVRLQTTKAKWL